MTSKRQNLILPTGFAHPTKCKIPSTSVTVSVYTSKDNLLEALSNDRNMRREHNADYIFGNTLNTVRD